MPSLNALRAFEAAARRLSLTRAAQELHVTAGALSHQIRTLEDLLGVKLFERLVRSIALTPAGKLLYPGLQTGFARIAEAVAGLGLAGDSGVLVISTAPGFTSKWLAPRLYRFAAAHPEIDVRVSSSFGYANFASDGVDAAVRSLPSGFAPDPALAIEKLIDLTYVPVCSPRLIERYGPFAGPEAFTRVPLIHDDTLVNRPCSASWADWFQQAGLEGADLGRGLHFNSSDHALDAAGEGAGVLLAHDLLAYNDLRTGRLVIPVQFPLRTGRAYYFVCPRSSSKRADVQAFRTWIRQQMASLDWQTIRQLNMIGAER